MTQPDEALAAGRPARRAAGQLVIHADCLEWLEDAPAASFHAVVTDPPYGIKEYDLDQLEKRAAGRGGVWRIPPSYDGARRRPLPRFTALSAPDRRRLERFFKAFGERVHRVLRPGGHVFVACNVFLSRLVFGALVDSGLEFRGEIIRTVTTLRGGDRPKNAEREFPEVCSLPRGGFEPWGLFRRPTELTLAECLRRFGTGGLRRRPDGPFRDLIPSERTPRRERDIAPHPSLKPQSLMRELCHAALPLGEGLILDPFAGLGSTLAAARACGLDAVGIERDPEWFADCARTIPALAALELPPGSTKARRKARLDASEKAREGRG